MGCIIVIDRGKEDGVVIYKVDNANAIINAHMFMPRRKCTIFRKLSVEREVVLLLMKLVNVGVVDI